MKVKITKSWVDKQPFTKPTVDESGKKKYKERYITDTNLRGFGVIIGSSKKTYYTEKRINGKTVRVRFGEHGQITTEQARRKAQKILGSMADGINPVAQQRDQRATEITLKEASLDYHEISAERLEPRTIKIYEGILQRHFKDWLNKPLTAITKDMVQHRYKDIKDKTKLKKKSWSGNSIANLALHYLSTVFNHASNRYEASDGTSLIPINPVKRLSAVKAWSKDTPRKRNIIDQLPEFFDGLDKLPTEMPSFKTSVFCDYIRLLLLTGLRKEEGAKLKWSDIDFKKVYSRDQIDAQLAGDPEENEIPTLFVAKTKNKNPYKIPLSKELFDLLKKRYDSRSNDYVFPSSQKPGGHFVGAEVHRKKLTEISGVEFMIHDLRRTFVDTAEELRIKDDRINTYDIKRLVNHTISDVTENHYKNSTVKRLQNPMQRITDKILLMAGKYKGDNITPFRKIAK